jgi:uncharacterized OsmC-like protein
MALKSVTVRASYASKTRLSVENLRGASLDVALAPSAPGFSPLELQASSLAACIAMSVKIAARQEGLPPLEQIVVEVVAAKAADEPSRLKNFAATVTIGDPLPPGKAEDLVRAAEDICTISNTLRSGDVEIIARPAEAASNS